GRLIGAADHLRNLLEPACRAAPPLESAYAACRQQTNAPSAGHQYAQPIAIQYASAFIRHLVSRRRDVQLCMGTAPQRKQFGSMMIAFKQPSAFFKCMVVGRQVADTDQK